MKFRIGMFGFVMLVLGALAGAYGHYSLGNGENIDYSQQLILSELRQQSVVFHYFSNNDKRKVSEFLLGRIQSDLNYFDTTIQRKELKIDKSKLCETISNVNKQLDAFLVTEVDGSREIRQKLMSLTRTCNELNPAPYGAG